MYKMSKDAFFRCVKNIFVDDYENYESIFGEKKESEIFCELASIQYLKNFEIEDLYYFDKSSELNICINLYAYTIDADGDKELLCLYRYIMDDEENFLDDMLISQ